ncbi:MAG: hypothetical protein WB542_18130 [Polaromonas sp.]
MAASNDAQIWGVIAASGSGKGVWIKNQLRRLKPARLVIWDYKVEYSEFTPLLVSSLDELRRLMIKARGGPLRVRFKCKPGTSAKQTMVEFEAVCRLVQAWQNCIFVAEELSNVTTPGWAPAAWREMTTGGRHEGIHIIGTAQNPALIDKTFLSNCTMIHVGPLREYRHRQAVARSLDVPIEKITALQIFQWIERDFVSRQLREGMEKDPRKPPTGRAAKGSTTGAAKASQGEKGAV